MLLGYQLSLQRVNFYFVCSVFYTDGGSLFCALQEEEILSQVMYMLLTLDKKLVTGELFQRRPKGLSLTITLFYLMSHAFHSVSHKFIQSMCSISGLTNCSIEMNDRYRIIWTLIAQTTFT